MLGADLDNETVFALVAIRRNGGSNCALPAGTAELLVSVDQIAHCSPPGSSPTCTSFGPGPAPQGWVCTLIGDDTKNSKASRPVTSRYTLACPRTRRQAVEIGC